ncbi:unnamed protein product [Rhodiola kirilowii]
MQRVFPYHGNLFSLLSSEQMQHSISDARIIIILSSPICEPISGKPIELPTVFILFVLSNSLIPFSDTNLTISAPTKPKQPIKKGLLQAAQFIEHQLNSRQPDSIKSNTLSRSLIPKVHTSLFQPSAMLQFERTQTSLIMVLYLIRITFWRQAIWIFTNMPFQASRQIDLATSL